MKNVLEYLENSAEMFPEKIAFADEFSTITYRELLLKAQMIGSVLIKKSIGRSPVAVLLEKTPESLTALMGVVYSGCFYTVLDTEMPAARMNAILKDLAPAAVLTDQSHEEQLKQTNFNGPVIFMEDLFSEQPDREALLRIRAKSIDTDPVYVLFTSGSTGVPKGVVVCHRSVIAYTEWVGKTFHLNENTVFGNQTPFYFSMSVLDLFSTLRNGAALHIIPKKLFVFPAKLIDFLRERNINTLYWVPSALAIVSNWKLFEYTPAPFLKTVLFAGEVMPAKVLNYWTAHLSETLFANLYGPTEVTDICTYYIVNRVFGDAESIPIGNACDNCDVLVVTSDGREAKPGEEGELLVRGSFLAMGYYNNPGKTAESFVQNPLNPYFPEPVYKTGDIVKRNSLGELLYVTRKDFQIKHMGYRIELGEIEACVYASEEIESCAAIYDTGTDQIVLFYQSGAVDSTAISEALRNRLPKYMLPSRLIRLDHMLYNQSGKIDRNRLKLKFESEYKAAVPHKKGAEHT